MHTQRNLVVKMLSAGLHTQHMIKKATTDSGVDAEATATTEVADVSVLEEDCGKLKCRQRVHAVETQQVHF